MGDLFTKKVMNKPMRESGQQTSAQAEPPPALLFEMIRSFVTLAATLNLSHAVKELDSTRQTVRRHIATLENNMGAPLFTIDERRYQLSATGERALPGAKDILARGVTWLRGDAKSSGNLQYLRAVVGEWDFYQEQKPIGLIWTQESPILREAFRAWAMSSGHIEDENFAHIRPYLMVYRESGNDWICVEFGNKSAYVDWFGLDYARSSIGRPIAQLPAGEEFGHMLNQAFYDIQTTQLARLDHVYTQMPQRDHDGFTPMAYQRLMMAGFFPDNSPAVMTLVEPSTFVQIDGLPDENLTALADLKIPKFDPACAIFEKGQQK